MYCNQCGKEISENSKFCSGCGCPIPEKEKGGFVATAILKRTQLAAVDQLVNRIFSKGRPVDDLARCQHVGRAAEELRVLLA